MDNFEHHYSLTNKDSKNKKFASKSLIMFENYLVENWKWFLLKNKSKTMIVIISPIMFC